MDRQLDASNHLYPALLGGTFDVLHPHVRLAHLAPLHASGSMDVVHGAHAFTPLLVWLMRLPAPGSGQSVSLTVVNGEGVRMPRMYWSRRIGNHVLRTQQSRWHGLLVERCAAGSVAFRLLAADDGALIYDGASMRVLGVPLWRSLAPRVIARVSATPHGWHVRVTVKWRGRLVCRYQGHMRSGSES
jgi:hypothetical protein